MTVHEFARSLFRTQAALHLLPERERRAVEVRFYERGTVGDVAAALGVSTRAATRILKRAIDRLKEAYLD